MLSQLLSYLKGCLKAWHIEHSAEYMHAILAIFFVVLRNSRRAGRPGQLAIRQHERGRLPLPQTVFRGRQTMNVR